MILVPYSGEPYISDVAIAHLATMPTLGIDWLLTNPANSREAIVRRIRQVCN